MAYAAAEKPGGVGGMSQSAGKKLVADDKPGKLPEHVGKAAGGKVNNLYRNKGIGAQLPGYAEGGEVDEKSRMSAEDLEAIYRGRGNAISEMSDEAQRRNYTPRKSEDQHSKGGKIKSTSGPPIGKDDGLIPAQKGEYVVRKSAVKKLGTAALNQVNKGRLPASKRLYQNKGMAG
jgi:hypothetical protein